MTDQDIQQDVAEDVVDAPEHVEETPEVVTPEPVKDYSDDDAQEAQLFGWKSPDQWQGEKPEGYIDNPKEYLDRVKRSRIFQTMEEKMAEQERKLSAVNERALERQKAEHERKMQEVSARQRRAVEEADTDAYDAAEKERMDLMRAQPQEQQPKVREIPPAIKAYHEQNEWAKDPVLWREAVEAVNIGLQQGLVGTDPESQLKFAEDRMFFKYPHLKPKAAPKRQMVDGGGLAGGSPSGRVAFDKLPTDAKATFQRFVAKGIFAETAKDKEEYAREYNNA